jgi:tripartite-type tricarboxylate transporter receptor subunit TctC
MREDVMKLIPKRLRALLIAMNLGVVVCAMPADAQKLPDQIRIINTTAAGGGSDTALRIITQWIGENRGQTVFIEARPGGSGSIAMNAVKIAQPDGATLVVCDSSVLASNVWLYRKLSYELADFEPVTTIFAFPLVLGVPATSSANSLAELIAKGKTVSLSYGSQSVGSGGHLLGAWVAKVGGIDAVHIPFRGSAPAVTELLANRIDLLWAGYASLKPFYESKQIKLLATTAQQRMAGLTEIPTAAEAGYPQLAVNFWFGLCAPAKTPRATVNALYELFSAAVRAPAVIEKFREMGTLPQSENPAEFKALIERDIVRVKPIIEATGAQFD